MHSLSSTYSNTVNKKVLKEWGNKLVFTTRFTYDGFGNITQKWEKSDDQNKQRVTNFAYDNRGDLIYLQDPEKNEYNYTYDALGNLVEVIQNGQPTTRYHYNALSWKLQEDYLLDNKVERYSYTSNGDVATFTDKTGNQHSYQYSPYYELEKLTVSNKAGATVYTEESNYDEKTRQLTSQTNGQYTLGYGYDAFNRMTSYTVSGKNMPAREYKLSYEAVPVTSDEKKYTEIDNLDDAIDSFTYPGMTASPTEEITTIKYSYDQLERLQSLSTTGFDLLGGEVKYSYTTGSSGDSTTVSYPDGPSMTQRANSLGQIQTTTHSDGWAESNTYDAFGNISRVLHSHNNKTWNYEYDKIDRLVYEKNPWDSVGVGATAIPSANAPSPLYLSLPTTGQPSITSQGIATTDQTTILSQVTAPTPASMSKDEPAFAAEYVTSKTGDPIVATTAADSAATSEGINSGSEQTSIPQQVTVPDSIQSGVLPATTVSVPIPKNRPKTYKYDGLGNRQQHTFGPFNLPTEIRSYEYDALNRLTKAQVGETEATYTYYPGNLRASKTVDGKTTQYIYMDGLILEELDEKGNVTARNIWGNDLILRHDAQTNQSVYYLYNSHGDVVKVIDKKTGEVLNQYEYDAWGNPSPDVQADEQMNNPFRYSGEPYDSETGFYYLRARFYDPSVGRFITEDTLKGQVDNPLSLNRYTYVLNNPLQYIDPTGHLEFSVSAIWNGMSKGAKELPGAVSKAGKELPGAVKKAGIEHIGKENVKTLTDGKWNRQDVHAAGSAAVNVAPAGKLGQVAKSGAKTTKKVVAKTAAVAKKCNCFTAGTLVLTDKGEKPIEDIEVGDKVLAKDDETGEIAYKEVEWLFQRDVEETYNIFVGDEVITTTDEHPFWIVGKGWVETKNLVVGDVLTTSDGKVLAIKIIDVKKEHKTVYNFMVKDFHTYFVSNLGIWTHNSCWKATQFASDKLFTKHFNKHVVQKQEWASLGYSLTKEGYIKRASNLLNSNVGGNILGFTNKNGFVFRYNKATNEFATAKPDGTIETLFRPDDGMNYWRDQVKQYGGK
ncbi:polymorphic toxin-type HINT domain-containing protein [Brevibacillus dissolubilis]|uniref:polymorphic toxin-type HINT domain-containing protein n=1 Tax=Brevibacillus dissolubilis TaxID=1844116 RepID=UPI0011176B43|nr:polymorphic toxin-type HINT domain-containing protein [Brevibacillus dissolubilis]